MDKLKLKGKPIINGIIIDGKVYEALVSESEKPCEECAFKENCKKIFSSDYANLCMDFDHFTGADSIKTSTIFKEIK